MDKPLALSTAYATWVMGEHDNMWVVRDEKNKELGKFPSNWTEKDCMIAIRLGRKYELEAFNIGIALGKEEVRKVFTPVIDTLRNQVTELEHMNVRLSGQLEKFIIGEDDGIS